MINWSVGCQGNLSWRLHLIRSQQVPANSQAQPWQGIRQDVQVQLWDDSTVSGQLQEPELTCQLAGGLSIKVPVRADRRVQSAVAAAIPAGDREDQKGG